MADFIFNSPSVKFRERDLTSGSRNRKTTIIVSQSQTSGNNTHTTTTTSAPSNLQWIYHVMYNDTLLYNSKIWNND